MKFIFNDYPEGCLKKVNQDELLPWQILKENGGAVRKDNDGMILLHHACRDGAPYELLKLIVNAYSKACSKKVNQGKLPWQILKENGAALHSDKDGRLLLHHACHDKSVSLHLLKLLLDAYPKCIDIEDNSHKTPKKLLTDSGAAKLKNHKDHRLLLHSACLKESMINLEVVVNLLIDAYPDAVTESDEQGMTPLYLVCENADSGKVLRSLVHFLG